MITIILLAVFVLVLFVAMIIVLKIALPYVAIELARKGHFFTFWEDNWVILTGSGNSVVNYFGKGFDSYTGEKKDGPNSIKRPGFETKSGTAFMGLYAKKWKSIPFQVTVPVMTMAIELRDITTVTVKGSAIFRLEDIQASLKDPDWQKNASNICIQAIRSIITEYKNFDDLRKETGVRGEFDSKLIGNSDLQEHLKATCGRSLEVFTIDEIVQSNPSDELSRSKQRIVIAKNDLETAKRQAKATYVTTQAPIAAGLDATAKGLRDLVAAAGTGGAEVAISYARANAVSFKDLPPNLRTFVTGTSPSGIIINPDDNGK
jgi:hypothetical protein